MKKEKSDYSLFLWLSIFYNETKKEIKKASGFWVTIHQPCIVECGWQRPEFSIWQMQKRRKWKLKAQIKYEKMILLWWPRCMGTWGPFLLGYFYLYRFDHVLSLHLVLSFLKLLASGRKIYKIALYFIIFKA